MEKMHEVLKFAVKQWISKGYPLNSVRYRPKESDLKELSCFSSFAELEEVAKKANVDGFFKIVEHGRNPCYTITVLGFNFLYRNT